MWSLKLWFTWKHASNPLGHRENYTMFALPILSVCAFAIEICGFVQVHADGIIGKLFDSLYLYLLIKTSLWL